MALYLTICQQSVFLLHRLLWYVPLLPLTKPSKIPSVGQLHAIYKYRSSIVRRISWHCPVCPPAKCWSVQVLILWLVTARKLTEDRRLENTRGMSGVRRHRLPIVVKRGHQSWHWYCHAHTMHAFTYNLHIRTQPKSVGTTCLSLNWLRKSECASRHFQQREGLLHIFYRYQSWRTLAVKL